MLAADISAEFDAPELPIDLHDVVVDSIEHDTLDLPLLPEVAQQVLALTTGEETNLPQIAAVLRRDQSMAGHLLEVANSPVYAPRVPIVSLQQAVSRLGARQIRDMALVITCKNRVFSVAGYEDEVRALYRHSVAAGVFSQEIARRQRSNVEEAFLCGLLHDVGRPVLLQAIVDRSKELRLMPDQAAVASFVEQHHARVGAGLARRWKLSPKCQAAIEFHHEPFDTKEGRHGALLVSLADALADVMAGDSPPDTVVHHPAVLPLNLYPDDVDSLIEQCDRASEMVRALS